MLAGKPVRLRFLMKDADLYACNSYGEPVVTAAIKPEPAATVFANRPARCAARARGSAQYALARANGNHCRNQGEFTRATRLRLADNRSPGQWRVVGRVLRRRESHVCPFGQLVAMT